MSAVQRLQVAVDCAEPHALARFWAAATGMEVEDHSAIVEEVLAAGFLGEDEVVVVDGRQAFRDAAACHDPSGRLPRLLFQRVPEPKTVKNRWHVDLHVGEEERPAFVARLEGLGATHLWDGRQGPQTWVTMADPEGNEFCVS